MQLSPNFHLREFASRCGRPTPVAVQGRLRELAEQLQVLRNEVGRRITITSGYRSPEHNRAVGGATASRHMVGDAADIQVEGMSPGDVAATIERLIAQGRMKQGGLKAYATFTHYDCRGVRARW